MKIFIDCEWNDYGGELISMALVSESGNEFYECLPCELPSVWIAENVIPVLHKDPIDYRYFQEKLCQYLSKFDSIELIADWPEDIAHFCECLIVGAGLRMNTPEIQMKIVRCDAGSEIRHNALSDARGLRDFLVNK